MSPEAVDFDSRYRADPDPWNTHSSKYERTKAAHTLAALPERPVGRVLEMGSGAGALTERLATRCEEVLATDFSAEAVRLTAARTEGLGNVHAERRDLRRGWPEGPFDAIVCSEVLYYWTAVEVSVWLPRAERSLGRHGALVCVHWTGRDPAAPMDGESVHELLRAETALAPMLSVSRGGYLIDRFDAS